MPFDGTSYQDDPILKRLLAARAKFTGPESWFKGGREYFYGSNYTTNCIGTALGSFNGTPEAEFLLDLIGRDDRKHVNLAVWNNAPDMAYAFTDEHRTYEDVIELLDRAIEKRRSKATILSVEIARMVFPL